MFRNLLSGFFAQTTITEEIERDDDLPVGSLDALRSFQRRIREADGDDRPSLRRLASKGSMD